MESSKLHFKEAVRLFDIDTFSLKDFLCRAELEVKVLEGTLRKYNELYSHTVDEMWNAHLYYDAIQLEKFWMLSPLHKEHKRLILYIYEIKSFLGLNNRLSQMDIERARRVPLTNILGRKGPFKCPFHNEKTPSLFVKQHYFKCFGCGEKGDNITFVMKTNHLDFRSAVAYILEHE